MGNGQIGTYKCTPKLAHTNAHPKKNVRTLISKRKYIKKKVIWMKILLVGGEELIDSSYPSIYHPLIIFYNYFAISEGQAKSQHMLLIWGLKAAFPKLGNLEASLEVQ